MLARLRAAVAAVFFRQFFRLFLFLISVAQWVCAAWVLAGVTAVRIPAAMHGLAVLGVYGFNRWLINRPRPRPTRSPGVAFRVYAASAFVSLFCALFLLVTATVWWTVVSVAGQLQAVTIAAATVPSERALDGVFTWVASSGMGGLVLLFVYGYVVGQRQVRVSRIELRARGAWPMAAPLRIVHVSDIHVGQNLSVDQIRNFVRRANDLDGDLICITGDIIDAPHVDYATYLPILAELRARAGVVAILGNHDHRAGAHEVVAALQSWTAFRVLRDEAVTLTIGESAVHVIGLDDRGRDWARGVMSDARLAELVRTAPAEVPTILLAHRPDVFPQAAAHGIALTLSGHTHGGQLALPWFGGRRPNLAEFITDFSRGLYERDGHFLYVSCGIGVTAQPIRLFTPREITLIEVVASEDVPPSARVSAGFRCSR